MHHHGGPSLLATRAGGLGEGGVKKVSGRRGGEPKWTVGVGLVDNLPVVRQLRHLVDGTCMRPEADAQIAPVGLKAKFSIRPGKAVQVMRGCKFGLTIDPTVAFEHFKPSPAGILQSPIDEL